MTPSIDITATKIDEKKARDKRAACDEIIHFDSVVNDIGEQDVPRKRLLNYSTELNPAADKTNKPLNKPKIRYLLDGIINDNSSREQSVSQGSSQNRKLPQKKVRGVSRGRTSRRINMKD